jgi:CBS domain-containing protein
MTNARETEATSPPLVLRAETAADLMSPSPVSIRAEATVQEAVALLTDKGIGAAPVIDEAGRPVGVLSRTDLLAHDREKAVPSVPDYYAGTDPILGSAGPSGSGTPDAARVRDLMTPAVFSVAPEAAAGEVVGEMLALKVHRLFVVDRSGVLVGVISALDVLRHLRP